MSYSQLFMKSGFPRAPLQNGVGRYVCQLQRVTLKFCKNNGSSRGMRWVTKSLNSSQTSTKFPNYRDFIEHQLLEFAKANPGVVVYVKPRRHRTAVMVGEYCKSKSSVLFLFIHLTSPLPHFLLSKRHTRMDQLQELYSWTNSKMDRTTANPEWPRRCNSLPENVAHWRSIHSRCLDSVGY